MPESGSDTLTPDNNAEELSEEVIIKRKKRRQDRRTIQETKIAKIKARDGELCYLCGKPYSVEEMTMDHLIPKSKGGSSRVDNLKLTHARCNVRKGDFLIEDLELPFVWEDDS